MRANLLLELFVEELPPKALRKLGDAFGAKLLEGLTARGLADAASVLTCHASPRRLAAHVTGVLAQAPDSEVLEKLVPLAVGIKDDAPTDALRKRLAKLGRAHLADRWPQASDGTDSLIVQHDGKADAIYLKGLAKGSTLQVGLQASLDEAVAALPIPKVMSYQLADGWSTEQFVRPVHGLVALHGDQVVPLAKFGLKAGNTTQGHRFEATRSPVVIAHADHYAETLERDGAVIASFERRRTEIARQLGEAARRAGASPDGGPPLALRPVDDDALLDEVTALVERPHVLVCQFEPEFLEVPQECLILTMKANQKYFPLLDADGRLTHRFLVVSNIRPEDASAVVSGNERVVRPRLADARFFFYQDRKKTLESRVPGLGKVVYHNKLGSQGERIERVRAIARHIAAELGDEGLVAAADRAALLAKADLLTDMVGEFPELQGIMGGYYARHDGLGEAIAEAIEDHYRPRFAGDVLPRNRVGLVVALADKLETIVGMFGIGNLPSGDRDPFALRRHALGVVRMLVERTLPLDLGALIATASASFGARLTDASASNAEALDFIHERIAGYLRDGGWQPREVDAVLAVRPPWGEIPKRLAAVRAFASLPESEALAAANKRIGNILKKSQLPADLHVDVSRLVEPAECALHDAIDAIATKANLVLASGQFATNLQILAGLRRPVDAFFDGVMVNAEDEALRANRLALLAELHRAMNRVADLARLAA